MCVREETAAAAEEEEEEEEEENYIHAALNEPKSSSSNLIQKCYPTRRLLNPINHPINKHAIHNESRHDDVTRRVAATQSASFSNALPIDKCIDTPLSIH